MMRDFYKQFDFKRSKPIAEDYLSYLTPATHLLELRREKAEVEKALVTQKEEFQLKMDSLKRRQEELDSRDFQLRKSLEKFDTFVMDNDSKKARALKKADEERKLTLVKDHEIERLNSEMESLTSKRADLLKKLHAHRKFNTYMNAVLEASDDFHETRDVIARHRTLVATQQDLIQVQQKDQQLLDQQKQDLAKYIEEKDDELMRCNMKVAELQTRLDQAVLHSVTCDYQWSDFSTVMSQRAIMIGRIIMASSNLYYLLKTYGIRETEDEALMGPIKQLEKVRQFIEDMSTILAAESKTQTTSLRSSTSMSDRRSTSISKR